MAVVYGSSVSKVIRCTGIVKSIDSYSDMPQKHGMKYAVHGLVLCLLTGLLSPQVEAAEDIETIFSKDATLRSVCDRSDIEGFRYYFFHHAKVRESFVAANIRVIRPHKRPRKVRQADYHMPEFGVDRGTEFVLDAPNKSTFLKVETVQLPDLAFQLLWVRADYEYHGAHAQPGRVKRTYGPTGRLTFQRTKQCWELVEDRIDAAAQDRP